jgi:hypothetical protein
MLGLDHYAGYLLSAFGVTVVVLGLYGLYLRSRLTALRRRRTAASVASIDDDYSGRNVSAAAPMVTTAQAASSASGPRTP